MAHSVLVSPVEHTEEIDPQRLAHRVRDVTSTMLDAMAAYFGTSEFHIDHFSHAEVLRPEDEPCLRLLALICHPLAPGGVRPAPTPAPGTLDNSVKPRRPQRGR